jgi:phosphonate transport system permease protein
MTPSDADIAATKARLPAAFRAPPAVRARRLAVRVAFAALFLWCLYDFEFFTLTFVDPETGAFAPQFSLARIWEGIGRFGGVLAFMFPPKIWTTWSDWAPILTGLAETVAMAFLGTLIGAIVAFPIAWLGAKNINRLNLLRLFTRRGYDVIRAVETLVLALVFIRAFGLGPLAGVLAIATSEIGTFAKLFSEAIENTSERPVEGVRASGGGPLQTIRFATMPQVMPVILSIVLYNFESNVRSGTILGIVGAGGIGFLLSDRISAYRWDEAWTIIFLIILMVYVIDWLSGLIRTRLIGRWEGVR